MNIAQILDRAKRMSRQGILTELERLPGADDTTLERLQQQQAYLLLPDTEHSRELYYLVGQLRNIGQVEVLADRLEKIPVSGVGQAALEGYRLYATSLFIALSLLEFTRPLLWVAPLCALCL